MVRQTAIHYLTIILQWLWKNIAVNAYKFRILEILLYLFFMGATLSGFDGTSIELYWRLTMIGGAMFLINLSYDLNEYKEYDQDSSSGVKILFNNDWMRSAGFFIGGLLMLPAILFSGLGLIIIFGAIYILWISIKYIIRVFKK